MYNCDMVKDQFLSGSVHFFVISITARYYSLSRAISEVKAPFVLAAAAAVTFLICLCIPSMALVV